MKKIVLCLMLLVPMVASCGDCDPLPTFHKDFRCLPCNGDYRPAIGLSTTIPVPLPVFALEHYCFTGEDPDACWFDCPGLIEDSAYMGAELCLR